jgi:tetratricopeptide (TPR) repeat protein
MFRRLIIVPDDCLHYLPFAALDYDGEPLVDLFTVAKAPSLLALRFAERHQNLNENNLLIVQNAGDCTALQLSDQDGIRVQYLRGADWRDGEPRQKFQQAGIMHMLVPFAVQPRRPLDSGFRLQLAVNANTAPDSALVPLSRLFEFDLAASLITLANTNFRFEPDQTLTGLAAGDEMIALQRSLIYAGTPTIVLTQWPVAPKVSERFFTAFYKNLSGQPAVAALNAAQHAVREQFPDPHDWAGFELIGFPGLSSAEKSAFANRYFEETVLKGNEAQEMGEFLDAVRYYQSALTMAQQLGQPEAIQNLYLLIKGSAISGNDYATACEIETKILDSALAANNINQQARSYRNLAVWQLKLKNYEAAAAAERARLALAERLKNSVEVANSQLELAQIYETAGDYVAAMSFAEQAVKTFTAHQQILSRLQAEAKLGALAMANDQPALALDCLERGLRAFLEARTPSNVDERRELALAYQLTGKAYSRLTGYEQALTFHQKALAVFETITDTVNITRAEHDLADTYWLKGDFQNALVHEQRALKTARTSREKLLGFTTLGLILLDLGEFDAAFDAEKQALQLAFESEATRDQATIYKNLGKIHLAVKQYRAL